LSRNENKKYTSTKRIHVLIVGVEISSITAWSDATSTERNLRMTTIMEDGDMGFVVDLNLCIYSFDLFEDAHPHKADEQLFLPANKLSNTPGLSGCNMNENHL